MVRIILLSVGIVSTAVAGLVAKKRFFRWRVEDRPGEPAIYQPSPRPRKRKVRCSQFDQALDNGEHDFGPTA